MPTLICICARFFLFNTMKKVAPRVVMFLPRNIDVNQLAELSLSADPPWFLEVFHLIIFTTFPSLG